MKLNVYHVLCAALVLLSPGAATAADIFKQAPEKGRADLIFIDGKLEKGDEAKFKKIALETDEATVVLRSNGGYVSAAIEIGKAIRLKSYATAVVDSSCVSACALIWLAGQHRFVTKKASIGFHAVWIPQKGGDKAVSGAGNALVGAYLNGLGLRDQTIAYVTQAGPDDVRWLSKVDADRIGLQVDTIDTSREVTALHNLALRNKWANPPNYSEALRLYNEAAQSGFAGSQNNLGDMYENGQGAFRNNQFAVYWYARAAERGEPTAYLSLSTLLPVGTDDEQILVEALKFALLATATLPDGRNKAKAMANVESLKGHLSKAATKRALELAKDWEPLFQETRLMKDMPN
jgi:hypothetical protein